MNKDASGPAFPWPSGHSSKEQQGMTLQDLRTYYRLREYQISHLLNAQQFFKHKNGAFDMQMWLYLFYWADAMWEADQLMFKLATSKLIEKSRGQR